MLSPEPDVLSVPITRWRRSERAPGKMIAEESFPSPTRRISMHRVQILVERNLEIKELFAIRIAQLAQVQPGSAQRMTAKPFHVIKEKSRPRGVRLDRNRRVFKLRKILLDLRVRRLRLSAQRRQRRRHGNFSPGIAYVRHAPLHILRLGGWNPVACRADEVNPRVNQ